MTAGEYIGRYRLRLGPIDLSDARAFIQREHSHLDAPIGGKCAVAVERRREEAWERCCVALLGRPVSRELQAQGCAEVLRVAAASDPAPVCSCCWQTHGVTRTTIPHVASMCLAAISRAGLDLGYRRLVSSTLLGESGTMYIAAGWRAVACDRRERDWERSDGYRSPAGQPGAKVRWETGPDALAENMEVLALVKEMTGKITLRPRQERLPLLALVAS
jgi:hypothetical protein